MVKFLLAVAVVVGLILSGVSTADAYPRSSGKTTKPAKPSTATSSSSRQAGALPVPYIGQYKPKGADSSYKNGSSNCGPTSMAMIARYYKYAPGASMTDAELITHFNLADGKATGATDAKGIKAMAAKMGKPVVHRLGPDLAFVDQSIAAGKPLAARGIFKSGGVRHYIVITGKNSQGNYTVNDSASSSRKTVTPSQLTTFIKNHPEGAFFSIG